jgi:hypothetical protein
MPVRVVVVIIGALLVVTLTGCASDTEKYCGALKDDKAPLQRLSAHAGDGSSDVIDGSLTIFNNLRSLAPQDVSDEWATFVFAWRGLKDALDAAGVDPADYRPDTKPAGITKTQFADVKGAAEELRSPRVLDAARGIEQHAQDICKVDLGL